ncbi:MAG TPA: DUF2283 domain-containing protein [Syntrophales bacterium]|nr:DUF2283 domain-containing protein [Syntrophales bacterium]HXK44170.1 DUF2283 domain-containing protein [Anaerolineae bacterium]
MKLSYDREEDILMIETSPEGVIDHAEHTGPFIAHFSRDGRLLLLEILDASEFLSSLIRVTLRSEEQELPLTVA